MKVLAYKIDNGIVCMHRTEDNPWGGCAFTKWKKISMHAWNGRKSVFMHGMEENPWGGCAPTEWKRILVR